MKLVIPNCLPLFLLRTRSTHLKAMSTEQGWWQKMFLSKNGHRDCFFFILHKIISDFKKFPLIAKRNTIYSLSFVDAAFKQGAIHIWTMLCWEIAVAYFLHTSKKRKSLRSLLPSPKYFAEKVRKSQQQNFATKVRKSWNEGKINKKVGLLTTFLCNVGDIYDISSQYFDTSWKLLVFLTKFNRANLVVFAF